MLPLKKTILTSNFSLVAHHQGHNPHVTLFQFFPCTLEAPLMRKCLWQVKMVEAALYCEMRTGKGIQLHNIENNTLIIISNVSFMRKKLALLYLLTSSIKIEAIWCSIGVRSPLH